MTIITGYRFVVTYDEKEGYIQSKKEFVEKIDCKLMDYIRFHHSPVFEGVITKLEEV